MIRPFNSNFLTPTKKFRRLSVLLAVHNDQKISQHRIGEVTHLSSSMVNNYIKEFQRDQFITVLGETNRTQSYHLTSKGHDELISLLLDYSVEIIQLYIATKQEVAERLNNWHTEGIRSIALFGAAETAEVVHAAMKDTPLELKAVVDSDADKQGNPFNGLTVRTPNDLKEIDVDAVVITSFAKQEEINHQINHIIGNGMKVMKLSDL